MLHQAMHSRWIRERALRIDAKEEGGILFWRWDYWNAREAAWVRDYERGWLR